MAVSPEHIRGPLFKVEGVSKAGMRWYRISHTPKGPLGFLRVLSIRFFVLSTLMWQSVKCLISFFYLMPTNVDEW